MNSTWMIRAIWGAGFVHVGIIAANIPLPGRLRVRERLAGGASFRGPVFSVGWGVFGVRSGPGGSERDATVPERIHGGVLASANRAADFLLRRRGAAGEPGARI